MNKAQQLAEKLKQYIPNGDGYNSEFANDLAEAVNIYDEIFILCCAFNFII